jgi:hypothetical protein
MRRMVFAGFTVVNALLLVFNIVCLFIVEKHMPVFVVGVFVHSVVGAITVIGWLETRRRW